jgi:hypothetical protein
MRDQEYERTRYASEPGPGRAEGIDRGDDEGTVRRGHHEGRRSPGYVSSGSRDDFRGRGPRGYQRSSERIFEDVCEALTEDPAVDASDIEVVVQKGIVTLRGSVSDRRQKRRAEDVAEEAHGVRDVRNQLEIGDGEMLSDLKDRLGPEAMGLGEYRDPRWRSADFRDFEVHARDGTIGKVDHNSEPGADHLVVDTGPWIFGKKVVLPAGLIEHIDQENQRLFVSAGMDEIKSAPEFDEGRLDDPSYAAELRSYYGRRENVRERSYR